MSVKCRLEDAYPLLKTLGIAIQPQHWQEQICRFHNYLCRGNKKVNLTRITAFNDYVVKHIIDSLLLANYMPEITTQPLAIADVGCGAGFPGVPLAISYPNLTLTEIDSVNKKYVFVRQLVNELNLENCIPHRGRANELAPTSEFKYKFDFVTARAVANAPTLMQDCKLFLKKSGMLVLYKTPKKIKEEMDDVRKEAVKLNMVVNVSPEYNLPSDMGKRQFLSIGHNR